MRLNSYLLIYCPLSFLLTSHFMITNENELHSRQPSRNTGKTQTATVEYMRRNFMETRNQTDGKLKRVISLKKRL